MYWADVFADQIIKSGKHKPYWVDDMKTPSGRVHIGSVRAVTSHYLVCRALIDRGVETTFSYVLEDHDPMDKLPGYIDEKKFVKHLGKPLFKVPSPTPGYKSYGHRWGQEYKEIFNSIGIHPQVIWGSELYLSGKMNTVIKVCLDKSDKIRDIYKKLYDQKKPKDWYPFNVVCEKCGKMSTTSVSKWDGEKVTYECKVDAVDWTKGCGYKGKTTPFSSKKRFAGKLPWKVEWGCKWKVIGVTIEGAGKDHMTEGGSHDFSKLICKNVINYPVPYHFSHEFFLIGGRKMSSSKGTGSSAKEVSEIIPPYLIKFLIVKVRFNRAINFDPSGMTIPDLFDAYDKAGEAYWDKKDKTLGRVFELSQIEEKPPKKHFLPRFRDIARIIQDPKEDIKKEFTKIKGSKLSTVEERVIEERVKYAKIWLKDYAPQKQVFSLSKEIPEKTSQLEKTQKKYLKIVGILLEKKWSSPEDLQQELYDASKTLKLSSRKAFTAIYLALLGKTHGPKAAWLLLKNLKTAKQRIAQLDKIKEKKVKEIKIKSVTSRLINLQKEFAETYPTATIGFALVKGLNIEKSNNDFETQRKKYLNSISSLTVREVGEFPEIQSYRRMFRDMGVDWHSRRPGPEALLRRLARKGDMPKINTCVDAYNLIVMKNRVSVGAFDADKLKFPCQVRIAKGGEKALYIGEKEETVMRAGEVCYFDELGPYNMDYNYRDIVRTAVTERTKNIWINTEGIYEISPQQVQKTLNETMAIIKKYCGGKVIEKGIILAS
jgi:lysyl-tRNA synthetase class 1